MESTNTIRIGVAFAWVTLGAAGLLAREPYTLPPLSDLGAATDYPDLSAPAGWEDSATAPESFEGAPVASGFLSGRPADRAATRLPAFAEPALPAGESVKARISGFLFEGNTVFSDEELADIVADFTSRDLNNEDLEAARVAVTMHYVENGYVNSGALLPDQEIENGGTVTLKIVEGALTDILLEGNRVLRDRYLISRIRAGKEGPLNMNELQEPLLLLHRNTNIRRLNAEVKPGEKPGESYLQIAVEENSRHRFGAEFSNSRPPSVGEEQIDFWYTNTSLLGFSDALSLRYGLLDRGFDDLMHHGFRNFSAAYSLPVTASDTTLHTSYQRSSYTVIEEPFDEFDVDGQSNVFRLGVRQPLIQTANQELAAGVYFDRLRSQTTLFGEPFSVNAGAVDGRIDTSVLRLTQEWTARDDRQVLALRATESIGLDVFNPTDDGTDRDGRFFSFLGQGQYVRKIGETDMQFVLRGSVQLSNDPLLAVEQLSIGGANSVRGYRENQLVRDMGYLGSAELHLPLIRSNEQGNLLTLVPFFDVGGGWNEPIEDSFNPGRQHETIVSAGVGLLLEPAEWVQARIYWGHAFTDFESPRETLQDQGFHFSLSVGRF